MSHSQSFTQFKTSIGMAEALLNLEKRFPDPPDINDQQTIEGLRGGAVILMVAAFENFLKSAIVEHLTKLVVPTKIPFNKLPPKMLINSMYSTLEHAMKGPPSRDKIIRIPDIAQACQDIVSQTINPSRFGNTKSNPSPDNIKSLFAEIGNDDIFNYIKSDFDDEWYKEWLQLTHTTFINDKLDEIVSRRHVVAHTANALNISRYDLEISISFLKILTKVLDLHLEQHIENIKK